MAILIAHTVLINKLGEVLLLRRSANDEFMPGSWDLPGGTVEEREHPLDAATRETEEESGFKVKNLKPLLIYSNWDKKKQKQFVSLIFYTEKYQGSLKLNPDDHNDYIWVKPAKIKKMYTVPYLPEVVRAIKELNN
ncbi:MAG: NUDIX hydrolase [Candidatus Falkowbacteria bacterium]|nr:MAG: NUDIX hydrolase [Candidatus Falkowbacteria bacterium]